MPRHLQVDFDIDATRGQEICVSSYSAGEHVFHFFAPDEARDLVRRLREALGRYDQSRADANLLAAKGGR